MNIFGLLFILFLSIWILIEIIRSAIIETKRAIKAYKELHRLEDIIAKELNEELANYEEEFDDDLIIDNESSAQGVIIYLGNSLYKENNSNKTPRLDELINKYINQEKVKIKAKKGKIVIERPKPDAGKSAREINIPK